MAIRIRTLICQVTLTSTTVSPRTLPSASAAPPIERSATVARVLTVSPGAAPEAGGGASAGPSPSAEGPGDLSPSGPPVIDPRVIAERVYRLMLDDVRIGRERE